MSMRVILTLIFGVAATAFSGCKNTASHSHTTIQHTWQNPDRESPALTKLMVIGVAGAQSNRERYESVMAEALRKQGVDAEASYVVVGDSKRLTMAQARTAVEEGGFDGVILTHVLGVEERVELVEGKETKAPTSNMEVYMADYEQRYDVVKEPDHYELKRTYSVETIVYDAATGEKLWWAVSETAEPKSVNESIDDLAAATAQRMKDEGVIE